MFDDLGKATQGARLKSLLKFASVKAACANVSMDRISHIADSKPLMKTFICTVKLSLSIPCVHRDEYTFSSFVTGKLSDFSMHL